MTKSTGDVVALFPGQGSITTGAGESWRHRPAWRIVADVSAATDVDVEELLLRCGADEIVRTDRAQLATFALSLVGWTHLLESEEPPTFFAGHSLGEFSALVAGGVLQLDDTARVVAARGEAMRQASAAHPGGMVALMGGDEGAEERLRERADLWVANINGPGQIVVSGTEAALRQLVDESREWGWRRATPLPVGGAFHSPLMADARSALESALDGVTFQETSAFVASNLDGTWCHGGPQWRERLLGQLTSPVQFLAAISSLPTSVTRAVEMPPSGVLVGLTKRIRDFDELTALSAPSES